MPLGSFLTALREARDVSRKELARRTGLSLSYLHYIENDRTLPSLSKLDEIASALQLSRKDRTELRRQRELAELERLGVVHPEVALLLKQYGRRLSPEQVERLRELIPAMAAGDER